MEEEPRAAQAPSRVFARQIAAHRRQRGWTTADLAARLGELGVKLHPTAITRVEKDGRGVSLDESLAFAAALNVPLQLLFLSLDEEKVALTPELEVSPWLVLGWLQGETPVRNRDFHTYNQDTAALRMDLRLRLAQHRAQVALGNVDLAEKRHASDEARNLKAREDYEAALGDLGTALGIIADHGLRAPRVGDQFLDDMDRLGIEYRRHHATVEKMKEFFGAENIHWELKED